MSAQMPDAARPEATWQAAKRPLRRPRGARAVAAAAVLVSLAAVAAACAPTPPVSSSVADPDPFETLSRYWGGDLVPSERNIDYITDDASCGWWCDASHLLDIHRSRAGEDRGTIVFVHGGGFSAGDKTSVSNMAPILRQIDHGWGVVPVNYRLAVPSIGQNLFPAALHDVAAAVAWVRAHGAEHGLDPSRIVLAGESAGATIAALVGTVWNSGRSDLPAGARVDGIVSFAGVLDADAGRNSLGYLAGWAGAEPLSALMPSTYLDADDPPMWLIHGDQDGFVELTGATRLRDVAMSSGLGGRVHLDVVDRFRSGAPIAAADRNHVPAGGANLAALQNWLDTL